MLVAAFALFPACGARPVPAEPSLALVTSPVAAPQSSAPRSAVAGPPTSGFPAEMRFVGRAYGVRSFLLRAEGDRVALTSADPAHPLRLEGLAGDRIARVREASQRGAGSREVTLVITPPDAHDELWSIHAEGGGVALREDLLAGSGLAARREHDVRVRDGYGLDCTRIVFEAERLASASAYAEGATQAYVDQVVASGRERLAEAKAADRDGDFAAVAFADLDAQADLVLITPRFVSILVESSFYDGAAAHPTNTSDCATFDRATGKRLALRDVFATRDVTGVVEVALAKMDLEDVAKPHDQAIADATMPSSPICLTRRGVWLRFDMPHALQSLEGVTLPFGVFAAGALQAGLER